ncbi:extracellular superoxide dismutase [Cu-Zn] isoform X2 [Amia ocellicauda]
MLSLNWLLVLALLSAPESLCVEISGREGPGQNGTEEMQASGPGPASIEGEASNEDVLVYAACEMRPSSKLADGSPKVTGQVLFKQQYPDGNLEVLFNLDGLPINDNQSRAIHVHRFGDLSDGCDATAGHFNPDQADHPKHPGDFGNFTPKKGKIRKSSKDSKATLLGPDTVLGRAVVIHEKEDDLGKGGDAGSLLHGNAGKRLACCVIGVSSAHLWTSAAESQALRKKSAKRLAKKKV